MTPYYADDWLTIYEGDCRAVLSTLPADSVDCVVTSPPYWGLRDYGTATWVGGDAECDHKVGRFEYETPVSDKQRSNNGSAGHQARDTCPKCGATRQDSQLGLERTPEEYVANMVAVFREVRRVLKPTGTCFLNLGDSYATTSGGGQQVAQTNTGAGLAPNRIGAGKIVGLKPKDLVGIPWRVAFALQADGWYLRSDIIWSKPNPMPESVTDRPTKSHEYLFLLTKSSRYFFDGDAVREEGAGREVFGNTGRKQAINGDRNDGGRQDMTPSNGRNLRSVWTIATRPYPGAHFAVFPPELPERCIKAGSSERGVCPECGAPWERIVKVTGIEVARGNEPHLARQPGNSPDRDIPTHYKPDRETLGWKPRCSSEGYYERHVLDDPRPAPAVVLDPFAGSGTVGLVANRLSRRAILIDLNPEYLKQQMKRNAQTPLGLTEPAA